MTWFEMEVIDKETGDAMRLRVPACDQQAAERRMWRLGMLLGKVVPWSPLPDPTLHEHAAFLREVYPPGTVAPGRLSPQGVVWTAHTAGSPTDLPRLLGVLDAEADPIDRHFLLQKLSIYAPPTLIRGSISLREWVCWQWFAELPTIRLAFREDGGMPPSVLPPFVLADALDGRGLHRRARAIERRGERLSPLH